MGTKEKELVTNQTMKIIRKKGMPASAKKAVSLGKITIESKPDLQNRMTLTAFTAKIGRASCRERV